MVAWSLRKKEAPKPEAKGAVVPFYKRFSRKQVAAITSLALLPWIALLLVLLLLSLLLILIRLMLLLLLLLLPPLAQILLGLSVFTLLLSLIAVVTW